MLAHPSRFAIQHPRSFAAQACTAKGAWSRWTRHGAPRREDDQRRPMMLMMAGSTGSIMGIIGVTLALVEVACSKKATKSNNTCLATDPNPTDAHGAAAAERSSVNTVTSAANHARSEPQKGLVPPTTGSNHAPPPPPPALRLTTLRRPKGTFAFRHPKGPYQVESIAYSMIGDCVGWRLPLLAAKQGRRLVHTPYSATWMQGWCCFFVALGMIVR